MRTSLETSLYFIEILWKFYQGPAHLNTFRSHIQGGQNIDYTTSLKLFRFGHFIFMVATNVNGFIHWPKSVPGSSLFLTITFLCGSSSVLQQLCKPDNHLDPVRMTVSHDVINGWGQLCQCASNVSGGLGVQHVHQSTGAVSWWWQKEQLCKLPVQDPGPLRNPSKSLPETLRSWCQHVLAAYCKAGAVKPFINATRPHQHAREPVTKILFLKLQHSKFNFSGMTGAGYNMTAVVKHTSQHRMTLSCSASCWVKEQGFFPRAFLTFH